MATQPANTTQQDERLHDALIDEAEAAESGTMRNLFDLRMIIGGLFVVYGLYLAVRGLLDSAAAVEQAAGVRINLWTGLGALAVGGAFIAWALLRPLTLEEIVEGQAESVDQDRAHDELRFEREESARRPTH
jgi:hypothetical protein